MKRKEKFMEQMKLMKKNNSFEDIVSVIKNSSTIGVISHQNPDGDNIGSTMAMVIGIRENFDKNVFGIKVDPIPKFLNFLNCDEYIKEIEECDLDLLIYVDCGEIYRPGELEEVFRKRAKATMNIDHHKTNDFFADYNLVFSQKSSTCEIVFDLFKATNMKISKAVANALLTGINTDTNRFLYESCNASTLRACADLYELGADKDIIYKKLYQSNNFDAEMLKNKIINRAKTYFDNQVAITAIFKEDVENTDLTFDMVEDVVNYYRDIDGFEVSILFKEIGENLFKGSFRSKNFVDATLICSQLNGGGHKRASGCKIEGSFEEVSQKILDVLKREYFDGI